MGAGHLLDPPHSLRRARHPTRDTLRINATQGTGLPGAKPARFNRWVADLLGVVDGDELVDLFPGTGGLAAELAQAVLL